MWHIAEKNVTALVKTDGSVFERYAYDGRWHGQVIGATPKWSFTWG